MNKGRAAFTLPEVLVVIGIIAVLSLVLWAVMAPAMHVKAVETRIKSDLRQIAVAINVYANDYDGKLPYADKGLPESMPRFCQNCGHFVEGPTTRTYTEAYFFPENKYAHGLDEQYPSVVRHPFDPAIYPIAKAAFFQRLASGYWYESFTGPGRYTTQYAPKDSDVLAIKIDGTIVWDHFVNGRDNEVCASMGYLH